MVEDDLRALCLQVLQAKTGESLESALSALRIALNAHLLSTENLGIHMILNMPRPIEVTTEKGKDDDEPKA